MPGTPPTTPNYGLPRYAQTDAASFSVQVNAITDLVDTKLRKTMRTGHTFSIAGLLTTDVIIPPFFVPVVAGQTASLIGARARIMSGTGLNAQITKNGANVGAAMGVGPAATSASITTTLADGDQLGLTLVNLIGNATGLAFTLILEHVV